MPPSLVWSKRRVIALLVSITIIALGLRVYELGFRVFYYDEAWFGYWILRYMATGVWEYRPILHGPFFTRVNPLVFAVLGVSDMSARLIVALLGGLLPLSAWLFRDHLRTGELIALGVALAANPLLVYYSRFMRNDIPLAVFMFVTLGLVIRAVDSNRVAYLYGAAVTVGLAFTTKESVLLWVFAWTGAAILLLDRRLLQSEVDLREELTTIGNQVESKVSFGLRHWLGALGVFFLITIVFYAPRAGPTQPIGIWRALNGNYWMLPDVVRAATVDSLSKALTVWVGGPRQDHAYLPYLLDTLRTMAAGALGISVLAVIGFLADRYSNGPSRDLVAFMFYTGIAAVVGYPLANNYPVPWSTIHAIVPLAIPAAVGAYVVYSWGKTHATHVSLDRDRVVSKETMYAVGSIGLLVLFVVSAGMTIGTVVYQHPHESPDGDRVGSEMVYYAQAPGELRDVTNAIETAATDDDPGVDVLYVGELLAMDEAAGQYPSTTEAWFARMPLPWYTEATNATVASTTSPTEIGNAPPPPVVISSVEEHDKVAAELGNTYRGQVYQLDDRGHREIVVFTRT